MIKRPVKNARKKEGGKKAGRGEIITEHRY